MSEINLSDTKKLYETTNLQTANDYIALGWVLIETYKTCYDPMVFPNHQELHYVLAWIKSEPIQTPNQDYPSGGIG